MSETPTREASVLRALLTSLATVVMTTAFALTLAATLTAGTFFSGPTESVVTWGALALSLLAGFFTLRRQPFAGWLARRGVQWFLFLFNLAVGALAFLVLPTPTNLGPGIGLCVVGIAAGLGLAFGRAPLATADTRPIPVAAPPR